MKPARWQRVRTAAGWHLRLVGGNGEPILTSETYTDPTSVLEALTVVRQSMADGDQAAVVEVDERPTP